MRKTFINLLLCVLLVVMASSVLGETTAEMNKMQLEQTGWTKSVPSEYLSPAEHQGTLWEITYESKDYAGNGETVNKPVIVYLPNGYDEHDTETRYNILYLMHGWTGHAGDCFEYSQLVNILDHMIENGDVSPLIVAAPTFYNENSDGGFGGSVAELRVFHQDFEENVMPAVEGRFHTWAASISDEDLRASRDHRAFGGFSLGSVTTWQIFCWDYDYVRYFLPMSGSSWFFGGYGDFQTVKNVDYIEQLVKENHLDERGYYIYHAVGTQDSVKSQTLMQAEEMIRRGDVFTPEYYVFYQKDGGVHDYLAMQEFVFNALPHFFSD